MRVATKTEHVAVVHRELEVDEAHAVGGRLGAAVGQLDDVL
jgi:hypothetical protein